MLDVRAIREDPEPFRRGLARRDLADAVDRILEADQRRRTLTARVEELRAVQNRTSKSIGRAQGDEKKALIAEAAAASAELKGLEPELAEADAALAALLAETPNVPHESAPDGFTEEDAVEIRRQGEPASLGFEPRDHVALGELLGILDTERGARTSGSRFVYLLGDIVHVQFALARHALDIVVTNGFLPVLPPVLVREDAMYGTGFLPTDEVNLYVTTEDQLYLVGTSEVSLAAYRMGEILDESDLPLRYAGYSTCFRREAGTYGRDMGGMFRVHQFDKIEMFSFCRPEESWDEHEFMVGIEEEIVGNLEVPYRVVNTAAGDLGAAAAKKYDIEVWLPGQARYRELTSCSNCTDYQARRMQTRVRRVDGTVEPLHTLNGTATAMSRTLIAIMENHQREDGSVALPAALHPYLPPTIRELRPRDEVRA
ncbi:MAG TPA: serine--tRNA ligase [Actinomycetota bacterium]|nr:serine--tRNA ligase [Actinomycetota bacterium]